MNLRWNGYADSAVGDTSSDARYFGVAPHTVEHFQPLPRNAPYDFVDTSYFGFNIPEHNINAEIYIWFHRRLKVASGGIVIWQGMKPVQLSQDCQDWRHFMPMPTDPTDQEYPSGLRIKMTSPGGEFLIQYRDPVRETELELVTGPAMPRAVRHTGNHFTQAMTTKGSLRLKGKDFKIDGFFTRDRTWSESRSERPIFMPPLTWIAGTFGDRVAFHVMAYDSVEHRPEWAGIYPLEVGQNHLWGYIYRDGRLIGVKSSEKQTFLEADGITPKGYLLNLEDAEGVIWKMTGHPVAQASCPTWQNLNVIVSLNRWECEGEIGYGDAQEVLYSDHIQRFLRR